MPSLKDDIIAALGGVKSPEGIPLPQAGVLSMSSSVMARSSSR